MLDGLTELREDSRPFGSWPHDVHVTFNDIQQLREFVEPRLTNEPTDRRDARISFRCPDRTRVSFSIRTHRTKLVNDEWTSPQVSHPPVIKRGRRAAPTAIET